METRTRIPREIDVEGVHNLRHLGHYPTRTGRVTASHIYRSASLHRMPASGAAQLAAAGIRTVVDFRSEHERTEFATPDLLAHGINLIEAPVFESDASPVGLDSEFPGFAVAYATFLEIGAVAYRVLVEAIANSEGGLLFHCAAGKDRTGVAAALLLELAGVHDDHILEDHSHSCALLGPLLGEWKATMAERGLDPSRADTMLASDPGDIAALLGYLRERWGSAAGYFRAAGVCDETLKAARARILAP
jgi:protein-tyrosine phosphatase